MQSSIIGALLLVIVGCVQAQIYPEQLIGLNPLDRQLALGRNVRVGGRGSRFARNQIIQQQRLMDQQQALNNAIVSQQLRGGLVGNVGVVGSVGVPVVNTVVGGTGYGGVGAGVGLTGLSGCCARTDQQACIAVRPLSSYASGATCQRWYYDALTGTCQRATFDLVCANGRGFTNYFKSQALCLAKCGGAVVGGY